MSYTKGPWANNGGLVGPAEHIFYHPVKYAICSVGPFSEQDAESIANARLIAAAPALYEALEKAYKKLRGENIMGGCSACETEVKGAHKPSCVVRQAQAALAQARGEGDNYVR